MSAVTLRFEARGENLLGQAYLRNWGKGPKKQSQDGKPEKMGSLKP